MADGKNPDRRGKSFRDTVRESNPDLADVLDQMKDLTPITDFRAMSDRLNEISAMAMSIASSQSTLEGLFLRLDAKVSRLENKADETHACLRGDVIEHLLEASKIQGVSLEKTIRHAAVRDERIKRLEDDTNKRDNRRHGLLTWIISLTVGMVLTLGGYVWYFGGMNTRIATMERELSKSQTDAREFRNGPFSKVSDCARDLTNRVDAHASRLTMMESETASLRDKLSSHLEKHRR